MYQSTYAIGALVDSIGRVAVCSELVSEHAMSNRYSLSVESYIGPDEDPKEAIMEQIQSQLGINDSSIKDMSVLASNRVECPMNHVTSRTIHLYVFKFEKAVTMAIKRPVRSPIRFCALNNIVEVVNGKRITLSFSAERMISFLKSHKYGVLGKTFNTL